MEDGDPVKEAFKKVKTDIEDLKNELILVKESLNDLIVASTDQTHNPMTSTHTSTHDYGFKALKHQNQGISIGNEGVSTDRQTDRQTDTSTQKSSYNLESASKPVNTQDPINSALETLNSLDSIRKQIRLQFKRITDQELKVFSAIYQLEEDDQSPTSYKDLSKKLSLTESSIRDYVGRLIKKGIPVEKVRINNKNIQLKISHNLKKIASLNTILELRDL